tara:strand:+ start:128 stop:496 length:369 start_codon:yes stop_codon:yes gene_type:complete
MAHFAKVVKGTVTNIIVAEPDFFDTFVDDTPGKWIQTSYNTRLGKHYAPNSNTEDGGTPLRKNYATIGGTYDSTRDAFIPPCPYPSWILDEDTCVYGPPIPYPSDGKEYGWNETSRSWDEIE